MSGSCSLAATIRRAGWVFVLFMVREYLFTPNCGFVIPSKVETATHPQQAARPGFQSHCVTVRQHLGILRVRCAPLRITFRTLWFASFGALPAAFVRSNGA